MEARQRSVPFLLGTLPAQILLVLLLLYSFISEQRLALNVAYYVLFLKVALQLKKPPSR